jgi:hypothetical protein
MLKIRDDVDLKELEKFGFYKSGGVYQKNLEYDDINSPIVGIDICIYIIISDRIIRFSSHCKKETVKLDVLYDLIKADLVVKE